VGPGGSKIGDGLLDPGTYEYDDVDGQGFNVRFTVPAGWSWYGTTLTKGGVDPPDGAAIFFFGGRGQVYPDPCQWANATPGPPTGSSAADLVAALAAQPMRSATTPIDRSAGVWPGMAIELTVPDNLDLDFCERGVFRSWGLADQRFQASLPGQRDLVWAIDVNGVGVTDGGLIVDAASFRGTPDRVRSEVEAILGSIVLCHCG